MSVTVLADTAHFMTFNSSLNFSLRLPVSTGGHQQLNALPSHVDRILENRPPGYNILLEFFFLLLIFTCTGNKTLEKKKRMI